MLSFLNSSLIVNYASVQYKKDTLSCIINYIEQIKIDLYISNSNSYSKNRKIFHFHHSFLVIFNRFIVIL